MTYSLAIPDIESANIAASILLKEDVLEAKRLTTGGKNFVFAISTISGDFVIRMTTKEHKGAYESAIYWQNKLLPLGVPLAKFIAADLEEQVSPFPTLIMQRVPGDDLCNVYKKLSTTNKQNLAQQITNIHTKTSAMPIGVNYGFANSYEEGAKYKSWYDFLLARLELCSKSLKNTNDFEHGITSKVLAIADDMHDDFLKIPAQPFMWDTSERNVMVNHNHITAIIDVDDMCFGDPLFVLGLTYVALESLGFDNIYCDTWAKLLNLNHKAQLRLEFYRLFYTTWFMRHHADVVSDNGTPYNMNANTLNNLFKTSIDRIKDLKRHEL